MNDELFPPRTSPNLHPAEGVQEVFNIMAAIGWGIPQKSLGRALAEELEGGFEPEQNADELEQIRTEVMDGKRPAMDDTEIVLLGLLREMREFASQDIADVERWQAAAILVNAITALAEGTPYAELALKIVAAYSSTFEPGATT